MMLRPITRPLVRPLTRRVTEPGFGWSPRALFANGEQGAWYDPSDLSTLYQDSAGTTPVTAVGQPVGLMLDKSGRGNHAGQPTATARPTLQQDANGKYYLDFDGVDDFLSASLVLSAYPLTLAAAAKADANAEGGVVSLYQSSTQYKCISKSPTDTQWGAYDRNVSSLFSGEAVGTNATPHVLIGRFSTDSVNFIMDSVDTFAASANTNAFGTPSALYLGRTRATGLYLDGRVYGAGMVAKDISAAEQDVLQRFLALRSGATLA